MESGVILWGVILLSVLLFFLGGLIFRAVSNTPGVRLCHVDPILEEYTEMVRRYEPSYRGDNAWILSANGTISEEYILAEKDLLSRRFEPAVGLYLGVLKAHEMSPGEKARLLDALACIPVIQGELRYLERALEWARQARVLCPEATTLKGTQGSLLVESGQYREGIEMLQPLTEPGNVESDRAISACYLAKAWDRLGDEKQASYWMKLARESGGSPTVCDLIEPQLFKEQKPVGSS